MAAAIMLRVPIMTEESHKQNFILAEPISVDIDANDLLQVNLEGVTSSHTSINELGKQLLKAAADGNLEEVTSLMAKGAAFTADWLGTTPLHLAAQNNHLAICEVLLRAGISKDARTKVDRTPLHMAVYEGHVEIVETLLAAGADCDSKDMLLMTPLHWAAQNGHAEIAVLLIKYGATTHLVNKFNLTPVDIAQQIGRMDIVQIIMSASHDPLLASHHLAVQLANECNSDSNFSNADRIIDANPTDEVITPVETVLLEDDIEETSESALNDTEIVNSVSPQYSNSSDFPQTSLSESLKILQQHGITMLPSEEHNILSTAVESGHAVVLTEVGKQMLNAIKAAETENLPNMHITKSDETKKYVTITPDEFFALTGSNAANQLSVTKHVNNGKIAQNSKHTVKRAVMKKNKTNPLPQDQPAKITKTDHPTDMETVMKQLIEARKTIEEYKIKLKKKEAEAEKYKQQLKMLMEEK